ncbi:MAG: DUF4339 domain-containing protein [Synergistaceae bacterium]|jgi:hypothetical protein|nr:DUF4339 domain-containing protein [Synergistaceae bacterium]
MREWYYSLSGETHGPCSEEQMKGMLRTGEIFDDTMVWCPDEEYAERGWMKAGSTVLAASGAARWKRPDDSVPYTPPRPAFPQMSRSDSFESHEKKETRTKKKPWISLCVFFAALALGGFFFHRGFSFFVVSPEHSDPGKVLLMFRPEGVNFIDSADSIYLRQPIDFNFMQRDEIKEDIIGKAKVLYSFPYFEWMHRQSLKR